MEALIATMIAAVTLVGAAVTWRAAAAAAEAAGLDAQALRESVELQQINSRIDAVLSHDQRIFAEYEEHIVAWRALSRRVADTTDADLARQLRFEAHAELVLARTLRPLFRAYVPDFGSKDGLAPYDTEFAHALLTSGEPRLGELDPEATLRQAERLQEHVARLVAVALLLVGALCLLTVAELGRDRVRLASGTLGIVAGIGGMATFVFLLGNLT